MQLNALKESSSFTIPLYASYQNVFNLLRSCHQVNLLDKLHYKFLSTHDSGGDIVVHFSGRLSGRPSGRPAGRLSRFWLKFLNMVISQ